MSLVINYVINSPMSYWLTVTRHSIYYILTLYIQDFIFCIMEFIVYWNYNFMTCFQRKIFHKFCGFVPAIKNLKEKVSHLENYSKYLVVVNYEIIYYILLIQISDQTCMNDESLTRYFSEVIKEISTNLCIKNSPIKNCQKMMRTTKVNFSYFFSNIYLFFSLFFIINLLNSLFAYWNLLIYSFTRVD